LQDIFIKLAKLCTNLALRSLT